MAPGARKEGRHEDERRGEPRYAALASQLASDIAEGRLAAGSKLPGTRALAKQLGLSRNTVIAAYHDLLAQGWLEVRRASGTYVRHGLMRPTHQGDAEGRGPRSPRPGFEIRNLDALSPLPIEAADDRLDVSTGMPDSRLAPTALIARAYRRVMRSRGQALMRYGSPYGEPTLRRAVAAYLSETRGSPVDPQCVLITRGSQMAMALAIGLVVRPGDRVAVERYGYRPMWDILRLAGAQLIPMELDEHGMLVAHLLDRSDLRAAYVTPHHQYPTMAVLSPERRLLLMAWARQHGVAILEDDYDHEFHYEGRPVHPLLSADRGGNVLYCGSLSKILAPGIRIGFLVGPRPAIEQAARLRMSLDRQGDGVMEAAIGQLLAMGEVGRHARKVCRIYAERRKVLLDVCREQLGETLAFRRTPGGMTLWARIEDGTDPEAWARAAAHRGLTLGVASDYDLHQTSEPFVRLSFAALDAVEIRHGVRVLAAARRDLDR